MDELTVVDSITSGAPAADAARVPVGAARSPHRHRSRYIPALDGIRTLAVLAVILYHLDLPWAQGGLLGVTMFFVLSGYLITRLLLSEFAKSGRIDLPHFWLRRVRRLIPAIFTVVVVTVVLCTAFNHVMLTKMRPDIIPSLLFFNNWWQIIRSVSYFNAIGDPSPLTHFWSLAIEEQFYLIWPVLLFALLKLGIRKRTVRRIVLLLAAASATAMIALYGPAADPSRLYYGTDTRAFSLLLGCWLAFIPERGMIPRNLVRVLGFRRRPRPGGGADGVRPARAAHLGPLTSLDIIGLVGLVGLMAMTALTNGYTSFQYRGGTLLCSVLTMMLIAACVQRSGLIGRVFSWSPLVWIGKRSYGIYLWHYPLLLLMNPASAIEAAPWWLMVVQVAIVVAAAELSYHFIETPFRRGALGALVSRVRSGEIRPSRWARARAVPLGAALIVLLAATGGIAFVPDTSALSEEGAAALNGRAEGGAAGGSNRGGGSVTGRGRDGAAGKSAADESGYPQGAYDVLMVGDSVSLRAVPQFEQRFPHGHIDAAQSRQFDVGVQQYRSYLEQNRCGKIAVFALGTNGLVTDEMIDALMKDVGSDRIAIFLNTRSRQPWVGATNDAIGRAKDRYDNVRIIDWYGYSANRRDLFDGDGTHLSASGAREYIDLIYNAIKGDLPSHEEDLANDPTYAAVKDALGRLGGALARR